MLGLSKSTGYAIAALRSLSKISSKYEAIEEISRCAIVPKDYLAKIVGALARAGLVKTKRGVGGGISLACSPAQITLLEVVEAVEGPEAFAGETTTEGWTPSEHRPDFLWADLADRMAASLEAIAISDLCREAAARSVDRQLPAALDFQI